MPRPERKTDPAADAAEAQARSEQLAETVVSNQDHLTSTELVAARREHPERS